MGFGAALSILSGQGTDPCTCFNLGVSGKIGLPFWLWQSIANTALLSLPLIFARRLIGFGTFANMFLCGIFADLFRSLYGALFRLPPSPAARAALMLCGTFIVGVGGALYTAPDFGLAPYDCVPFILKERLHLDFRVCRICWDVLCVLGGWLLGSAVGAGTVLLAAGIGPLLHFLVPRIRRRFLTPGPVFAEKRELPRT